MYKHIPTLILFLLITMLLTGCGINTLIESYQASPINRCPIDPLIIKSGDKSYSFTVWVANTDARRAQGLMYQDQLDDNHGMLFLFDQPIRPAMWMKNTEIPLDFLFIAFNGKIVHMALNQTPGSSSTIQPDEEVTGVLELPGGAVDRLKLETGAIVHHPYFHRLPKTILSSPPTSPSQ